MRLCVVAEIRPGPDALLAVVGLRPLLRVLPDGLEEQLNPEPASKRRAGTR